jgi:FkbM family methyltransferase
VNPPIYAGADRALVRLRSGEFVCVDTNSLDSIDYLLGWEMESAVLPVFRSFLQSSSVVLDIGANFGLYTAVAGCFVKQQGRLYSFEGNPHTYELLERTLYANRLSHLSNVVAVSALVADSPGTRTLYYSPRFLGGATMSDVGHWGATKRSIEVEAITIDEFLPENITIDLAKIDVEGYEPLVLRGMQKTIRRSPEVRIFLEFVEAFLAETVDAASFVEEIDSLGLRICRLMPGCRLELVDRGQVPSGTTCCLLTRTPASDIAHANRVRQRLPARVRRWMRLLEIYWKKNCNRLYS